jgi:surface antigen
MFGVVPALGQVNSAQLSPPEQQATLATFQYALEHNKTNQAAAWVNPDTGTSGSLVPVHTYQNEEGQYCREYVTTITVGDQAVQGYGTACRQPDGTWMIVSDESGALGGGVQTGNQTVEQVSPVYLYPYGYPYWYLDYPFYVWDDYYPGIFFSFDIENFGGHRHYRHYPFIPWFHRQSWHRFDWDRDFGNLRHFGGYRGGHYGGFHGIRHGGFHGIRHGGFHGIHHGGFHRIHHGGFHRIHHGGFHRIHHGGFHRGHR